VTRRERRRHLRNAQTFTMIHDDPMDRCGPMMLVGDARAASNLEADLMAERKHRRDRWQRRKAMKAHRS
jgi:hypothetical protein